MGNTKPILLSCLEALCCDQATLAMRPCARLAGVELALLPRGDTTRGTSDSEYLLRGQFFFHRRRRVFQALCRVCTLAHRLQSKAIVRCSFGLQPSSAGRSANVPSRGGLDTARRMRRLRLPYRCVPCRRCSSTVFCLRSARAGQSIRVNGVRCGLSAHKRSQSAYLEQLRGIHGGSRWGIEGPGERTPSPGPSYPSDWQLGWTP